MKRNSITAIIDKTMQLTIRAIYNKTKTNNITKIKLAAVNEIIRLNAEPLPEIDMKKESMKFLESVKVICDDYNAKILQK